MAGAAVAGAVGAVALRAVPADASAAALTFDVNSYGASNSNQSNGTTGWYGSATYTNGASLLIMDAFTHTPAINAGGLQVFTKGTGTGGYFVSQSGYDLWINGTGRMAQLGRSDVGGSRSQLATWHRADHEQPRKCRRDELFRRVGPRQRQLAMGQPHE